MDWMPEESEPPFLYKQLVLSATGLSDVVHVASVVNASPNTSSELLTVMLFDFAVYTYVRHSSPLSISLNNCSQQGR